VRRQQEPCAGLALTVVESKIFREQSLIIVKKRRLSVGDTKGGRHTHKKEVERQKEVGYSRRIGA
jgi:hypothetical protein